MQIYNSVSHKKETFVPIEENKVKMYVCGPTVYDQIHIGNARTFLSFDVIRRYLMYRGYQVTFAQNITDVDDKIINRANETGQTAEAVATEFSNAFIEQMRRFKILDPDIRPRATKEIGPMIGMISQLIEKGHAYESNGDVYFAVRSYPEYGSLSGRDIDDLMVGARVEANDKKRDPLDFALWKAAKPNEPSWNSPWGKGRPGWHSECSAMVHRYLGTPIDIHGGGSDLSFPHHENEAAQACACWDHKLANYWMHTGMLLVDGEKMSKSLGNFFTLKEVLDRNSADALRLLMLQTHYRSGLDFSFERLDGAETSLERIRSAVRNLRWHVAHAAKSQDAAPSAAKGAAPSAQKLQEAIEKARNNFVAEMDDDFNTAGAVAGIFNLVAAANTYLEEQQEDGGDPAVATQAADTIVELLNVYGIDAEPQGAPVVLPPEIIDLARELAGYKGSDGEEAADALLEKRAQARAEKAWDVADAIRDKLSELGFVIEDTAQGARVQVKQK